MAVSHAKTITIDLAKSDATKIAREAKRQGVSPQRYVKQLIKSNLEITRIARTQTFAQIVPTESVADESEIDRLVETVKARLYKRTRKGRS
jgi:ABC-type uncharacterized transport system ATPase subunit